MKKTIITCDGCEAGLEHLPQGYVQVEHVGISRIDCWHWKHYCYGCWNKKTHAAKSLWETAMQTLYNIRHLAVQSGDPGAILRRIIVEAVDACDYIEGRKTSVEDREYESLPRQTEEKSNGNN